MAPCPLIGSHQPALWHLDAARGPSTPSFDHLVGAQENRGWKCDAECFGGLEIDDDVEFGRTLDRQIAGFCPLENLVYERSRTVVHIGKIDAIGEKPP